MLTKCISFSLWGHNPFYCAGAVENAILANKYFPEWDAAFYCDQTVPEFYLKEIQNNGGKVILKHDLNDLNFQKLFWRLIYPYQNYDIFITRDTDSRIGERDVWTVNRWLESTKIYHSIRDGFSSYNFAPKKIQGGTLGIKAHLDTFEFDKQAQKFIDNNYNTMYGIDETFINEVVYPLNKENFYIHATQYNNFDDTTELIPVDIRCEYGYYIGQKIREDNTPILPRYKHRKLAKIKP